MSCAAYYSLFFLSRYALMLLLLRLPALFAKERHINPQEVKQSQKDRESMWPLGLLIDSLLLGALLSYGYAGLSDGGFWSALLLLLLAHIFVVEPIYYAYHRLLHTDWLYRHHHIYHHRSVRTEATTSMSFTLFERLSYTLLFSIPGLLLVIFGLFNFWAILTFYLLFDLLNGFGHLNLKLEPRWYRESPLRWFIYSPAFHERHHSEFLTNYSLFIPFFDRLFGTLSKKSFEE